MTSYVRKVLAVHNDLAIGHGLVLQTRGPLINFERKLELSWIFRSNNEIRGLDATKYTRVNLYAEGPMPAYYFDADSMADDDDSAVLKPDSIDATQPGRWLLVPDYAGIVTHNDTLGLQGGIVNEYYHVTADEHSELLYHLDDMDNPHQTMHDQLVGVTSDQHHAQLHDIGSHEDVSITQPIKQLEVLGYDNGNFVNDRRTKVHFSFTQPLDNESLIGDLWLVM